MTIKTLLIQGRIGEAIAAAMPLVNEQGNNQLGNNQLENTVILLSGQFHSNEQDRRNGISDPQDYKVTKARISHALLEVLPDEILDHTVGERQAADPPPPPPPDARRPILFLAANPNVTSELKLGDEHSLISRRIQNSVEAANFPIKSRWATTLQDMQAAILDERPSIVHFSGHGLGDGGAAGTRDVGRVALETEQQPEGGIILVSRNRRDSQLVPGAALRMLFEGFIRDEQIPIDTVVLNACHSVHQAKELAGVVTYVVGTSAAVQDEAALAFSESFYLSIARGLDPDVAARQGMAAAVAMGEPVDRFVVYKDGKKL